MPTPRGGYNEAPSWAQIKEKRDAALLGGIEQQRSLLGAMVIARVVANWPSGNDGRARLAHTEFRGKREIAPLLTLIQVADEVDNARRHRTFAMRLGDQNRLLVAKERLIPYPDPNFTPMSQPEALLYIDRERPVSPRNIPEDEALTLMHHQLLIGAKHNKPEDI